MNDIVPIPEKPSFLIPMPAACSSPVKSRPGMSIVISFKREPSLTYIVNVRHTVSGSWAGLGERVSHGTMYKMNRAMDTVPPHALHSNGAEKP